jgi:protein TonB
MFESSLISLTPKKRSRRRVLALPIAVALHLVALASFTFANYWHIGAVGEPPVNTVFISASLPPLPEAKIKQGGPAEVRTKTPVTPPSTPVQPKDSPADLPAKDSSSSTVTLVHVDDPGPGDPNGDKNGDSNGSIKGVVGVPYSGQTHAEVGFGEQVDTKPLHVGGAVTKPVLIDGPQPRYTELARRAGTQGIVILEAIIDEQGRVTDLRVVKDLPMGLDKAALEAVRSWRFQPSTLNGRPVKVYYNLTVNFSLQH